MNPKVMAALEDEEEKKESRKRIYLDEKSDTQYWEQVYKDTGCSFDIKKLYVARDFDIWTYEFFYETGEFPIQKEKDNKMKEIKRKYKSK